MFFDLTSLENGVVLSIEIGTSFELLCCLTFIYAMFS